MGILLKFGLDFDWCGQDQEGRRVCIAWWDFFSNSWSCLKWHCYFWSCYSRVGWVREREVEIQFDESFCNQAPQNIFIDTRALQSHLHDASDHMKTCFCTLLDIKHCIFQLLMLKRNNYTHFLVHSILSVLTSLCTQHWTLNTEGKFKEIYVT